MGWTEHGEWLSFTANVAWTTAYQIEARVASAVDGGRLRVYLNGAPLGADLNVPNTGVWQVWTTLAPANPVNLTAGRHLLKLLIVTGGFNIDLIRFTNNSLHSVSAASYAADGTAAPASITSLFGVNLADATVAADSVPLPVLLGDVSVTVTDSTGHSAGAPLFFVSPGQINYLVPDGSAPGEALVTVTRVGTVVAAGVIQIEAVAPGLFSANGNGMGVAAGWAVTATTGGAQSSQLLFQCNQTADGCVPVPVDLGADGADVGCCTAPGFEAQAERPA